MSVSYAVDFAALLLLGPNETMLVAVDERVEPVHVPDEDQEPGLPDAVQHGVPRDHGAGLRLRLSKRSAACPARSRTTSPGVARPLVGAATMYFIFNTCLIAVAVALATRQSFIAVWNQNFLWSAPSYFVGAGAAALATWAVMTLGRVARAAAVRAALPHLSHLQGLSRPHRRRAPPRRGDGRSAPRDDRSARARDRREGSDRAVAHSPRPGLCHQHRARRSACRTPRSRASRPRRCCTTSASSRCPSTSCRSPDR